MDTIKPGRLTGDPNPDKFYTWTVELSVSATWVADGFNLADEDDVAALLLEGRLSHACGAEVKGKIVSAPPAAEIAAEQGETMPDIEAMRVLVKLRSAARERLVRFAKRANGAHDVFARDAKLDAALERHCLLMMDRTPTEMGWRVLGYLGVQPASRAA